MGLPIDILRYEAGSLSAANVTTIEVHDAYWNELRTAYADGLVSLVDGLPPLPSATTFDPKPT